MQPEVDWRHVYAAALDRLNRTSEALVLAEATVRHLQEKLREVPCAASNAEDAAATDPALRFSD